MIQTIHGPPLKRTLDGAIILHLTYVMCILQERPTAAVGDCKWRRKRLKTLNSRLDMAPSAEPLQSGARGAVVRVDQDRSLIGLDGLRAIVELLVTQAEPSPSI
jgi:hypothetical protein